jgi:hypothetical protein
VTGGGRVVHRTADVALRFITELGTGAFYSPCCWEALAVTEARDHCCGVLPHHRKGRTPAQSPSWAGHFSARSIGRASKGLRVPIATPTKACPHAGQSGPQPDNWISEISVRLFMARTLAPLPIRLFGSSFGDEVLRKSNIEQGSLVLPAIGVERI